MTNDQTHSTGSGREGKDILMLCHRVPYPPNKGDKIRSYHILRHLARRGWRVHLAALADDPRDLAHRRELRHSCASLLLEPMSAWRKLCSPLAALRGTAMSVACFRSPRVQDYVDRTLARGVGAALVVSAAMAEYLLASPSPRPPRTVLDLVDVDSEKWRAYAAREPWPANWLYAVEASLLGRYERRAGSFFGEVVLVSEAEAALFRQRHGDCCRVGSVTNGVDLDYFAAPRAPEGPRRRDPARIVFCGAMDYRPNVDAATWFAEAVFPRLRSLSGDLEFWIVGANPAPRVAALAARPGIKVTGAVPDVRPFLNSADLSVAPLRLARGLQNKVLEAMAMALPVLATPQAFDGIEAEAGSDLAIAPAEPEAFAAAAVGLLRDREGAAAMGARARRCVERNYSWDARLAPLEQLLA